MKSIFIKMIKIILLIVLGVCLFSIASKVNAFTIIPSNPTLTEGEELEFEVHDEDGKDISRKIKWKSEKTVVASIGSSSGKLTAKEAGTTTITAEHKDTKETVQFTVTVKDKITLNKTSITLNEDEEDVLIAYNNKGKEFSSRDIEWTSSNEKIVKVKKGEIEARKEGEATITVMNKKTGSTATCHVVVKEPEKDEPEKESSAANSKPSSSTTSTSTSTSTTKPTTSEKPAESTTQTQTPTTTIVDPEEPTIPTDTVDKEENEKEIEEVTVAATSGGFSINGLLSKITEIINKIINYLFSIINIGLNR